MIKIGLAVSTTADDTGVDCPRFRRLLRAAMEMVIPIVITISDHQDVFLITKTADTDRVEIVQLCHTIKDRGSVFAPVAL